MSMLRTLKDRFRPILAELVGNEALDKVLDLIRPAQDARFGDYQANMAMALGKQLGRPPREVAAEIVARLQVDDLCEEPAVAGPGFINLRLREGALAARLHAAAEHERLAVPSADHARTYVLDYSAPNVAKPMHVGHIRSTVIGDALCRVLRFLGHRVESDNHLGDWGTQFGMILYGHKHFLDAAAYAENPVAELSRLYRHVRGLADADEAVGKAVLAETARLHAGDEENRRLWQEFMPVCLAEIERMYRRLGVRFDHTLGESFYQDRLPGLVDELTRRGLARQSEGALAVFLEGHESPMLVQKQDGAFLYATTDLATIRYRMETFHPDAVLYVVDHRQSLHFEKLFAVARKLGYADVELTHVSFGTVLGDDGRPFRTREGDIVGLESLLDEAVRRAGDVVAANDEAKPGGPELSPEQRQCVAETVGMGALKYADLAQNRTSDYVFSFDKMLAMNGNTGTYMQYAYARIRSIFRKGNVDAASLVGSGAKILLETPEERALGLQILRLGEAIDQVVADYRPNQLTSYLFDLAGCFTSFYEKHSVLKAESDALLQSRLLLCDLTARTIRQGLALLGIDVVEQM